jgi:toxin-antitoxin system PIN domain toxin
VIVLDVNILLATHRADHTHHQLVRPWFDDLVARGEPFAIPGIVWASFIRISTNRRIFTVPTPLDDAFGFSRSVRAQPHHVALEPGDRHLELFEQLCRDTDSAGDLAVHAYLAAFSIEHGGALASLDRDFARFPSLTWIRPGD